MLLKQKEIPGIKKNISVLRNKITSDDYVISCKDFHQIFTVYSIVIYPQNVKILFQPLFFGISPFLEQDLDIFRRRKREKGAFNSIFIKSLMKLMFFHNLFQDKPIQLQSMLSARKPKKDSLHLHDLYDQKFIEFLILLNYKMDV